MIVTTHFFLVGYSICLGLFFILLGTTKNRNNPFNEVEWVNYTNGGPHGTSRYGGLGT